MSKRLDSTILQELNYAANRAFSRLQNSTLANFLRDEDSQDIVLRQLTIVGEAASWVSDGAKQRYPQIDWRRIMGMRNLCSVRVLPSRFHNHLGCRYKSFASTVA